MPKILFLVSEPASTDNDNHLRLPRGFAAIGWETLVADHDELRWDGRRIRVGTRDAERFDRIWLLGFGRRQSYYDRMQLLRQLDQRCFVNSVDAYTYLHGKLPLLVRPVEGLARTSGAGAIGNARVLDCDRVEQLDQSRPIEEVLAQHLPETYAAASANYLLEHLDDAAPWVLKPSGASFGRDVQLIRADAAGRRAIRELVERDGFAILQRYVEPLAPGEIRCLFAGGEVVGCYRRVPGAGDFRANLAADGKAEQCIPNQAEHELMQKIGLWLRDAGVGFAAADFVWPYIIEINVANPGGLATLEGLTGTDPTPKAVALLTPMPR